MDLSEGPPGAEGYEDSVTQPPKEKPKTVKDEKWAADVRERIKELKLEIQKEDGGGERPMVEMVSQGDGGVGAAVFLCYPCGVTAKGEILLDSHLLGKKHNSRISIKRFWPKSIYEEHPYIAKQKQGPVSDVSKTTLDMLKEEAERHNKPASEFEQMFAKYRDAPCYIQEKLDELKAPLIGVEYLVEHPPEEAHHEPRYVCVLCRKQGHPKTIINHLTCYWHKYNYISRHYKKAFSLLSASGGGSKVRHALNHVVTRLAQRVQDTYGRMKPLHIDLLEFERQKDNISTWIVKSKHFSEELGPTFEEVIDIDLINSLDAHEAAKKQWKNYYNQGTEQKEKSDSVELKAEKRERREKSTESLSDVSADEAPPAAPGPAPAASAASAAQPTSFRGRRYYPYSPPRKERRASPGATAALPGGRRRAPYWAFKTTAREDKTTAPNFRYKLKLAEDRAADAIEQAGKALAYHDKHPEKHPLYPEEWKKFWNRRYKEVQAEGKDPAKFDYKPEWIVYWTKRMKELHDEELRASIAEIYRKLTLTPPPSPVLDRRPARREPSPRRREPSPRRREPSPRRRAPSPRRREPSPRRRELSPLRREPSFLRHREESPRRRELPPHTRYREPSPRRREPSPRRREPSPRRREPSPRRAPLFLSHGRPSPPRLYTPPPARRGSPPPLRRHSPPRPVSRPRSRSPHLRLSPSPLRSTSPLSRREQQLKNRNRSPVPAMHTVLISDDEMKTDGLSDWDSPSELDSPRNSPRGSVRSSVKSSARGSTRERARGEGGSPGPGGPPPGGDTVIGTLRLLVALEEYLGSLGPRVVALLTEALRCEKLQANSSERLLDTCADLLETAKEKLKGATQAGLVPSAALSAARQCVVRVAALLHEADKRRPAAAAAAAAAAPAASAVCREDIARQMAAALVQQGKTDVSAAELAQLVDAVVAAAEAKRGAAVPAAAPTAALQLLQAAYDDPAPAPAAPPAPAPAPAADAMDGLSDSDLETLLKNFGELSADEQQSLVAYLRKLEAGDPRRVERLRSFVGEAMPSTAPGANPSAVPAPSAAPNAPSAPSATPSAPSAAPSAPSAASPAADSDDDDYTVEDVVRTATRQVLEEKRKQELECVTRSLEMKSSTPTPSAADVLKLLANVLPKIQTPDAAPAPAPAAPVQQTGTFGDSISQQSFDNAQQQNFNQPPQDQFTSQQSYNNFPVDSFNSTATQPYDNQQQQFNNQQHEYNDPQYQQQINTAPFNSYNNDQQNQFNNHQHQFGNGSQNFNSSQQQQQLYNAPHQLNNPRQQFNNPQNLNSSFNQPLQFNNPSNQFNSNSRPQQPFNNSAPQNAPLQFNNTSQQYNNPQQHSFNNQQQSFNNQQPHSFNNPQQQSFNNPHQQSNNAPQPLMGQQAFNNIPIPTNNSWQPRQQQPRGGQNGVQQNFNKNQGRGRGGARGGGGGGGGNRGGNRGRGRGGPTRVLSKLPKSAF